MAITFNPIITQGVVYWHTGLWEWSSILLICLHVNCVTYLEIFPAGPPPQITMFFLRNVKNIWITAISENSSFLAKSLYLSHTGIGLGYTSTIYRNIIGLYLNHTGIGLGRFKHILNPNGRQWSSTIRLVLCQAAKVKCLHITLSLNKSNDDLVRQIETGRESRRALTV